MTNYVPPGFEEDKPTLGIDFDGVIHDDNQGWGNGTCYGEPIPDAIESIKRLSQKYRIVIFSSKVKPDRPLVNGKTGLQLVKEWLEVYELTSYISEVTDRKPRAFLYIDDKGYRFENWVDTITFIG